MYEELVKDLRYLAKVYSVCENENTREYQLAVRAANAIEELSRADKVGTWIELDSCMSFCSECNGLGCDTPYCPNCVAKMVEDGE
ncbi:MAG: hypothetical protein J6S50_09760 [Oscillospiraceae bacterium]|nr:hypothetical protein [Oscillospiraceae bacterium]